MTKRDHSNDEVIEMACDKTSFDDIFSITGLSEARSYTHNADQFKT